MFKYFKNPFFIDIDTLRISLDLLRATCMVNMKDKRLFERFLRIIAPERADYHRISICQLIEMIIRGALGRE